MEDDGTFYDHLVDFATILYTLWPSGIFYGHLVIFSRFGMLYREKSGNPDAGHKNGFFLSTKA
jgi:hypothetical protein